MSSSVGTMATAFGSVSVLSESISAPSYQLSRLAILDRDNYLIANADQLKLVNVQSATPLVLDEYLDSGNVSRCNSFALESMSSIKATPSSSSDSMFQSVRIIDHHGAQQAAAVTSEGGLVICPLHCKDDHSSKSFSFGSPHFASTLSTETQGCGYVSLTHTSDRLISAHYLSKSLVWNDLTTLAVTRQSTLFRNPTCVVTSFPSSGNKNDSLSTSSPSPAVVIVAEGANIAVFDEREQNKGGCVFRENENNNGGTLWDILPLADSTRVAAAGSDKNIRIYDVRMWKPITKWRAPHKFDVVKLLPSSNSPLQLYVAGRDNEVLLCDLEPHLLSTQVQKVKSRKQAPSSEEGSSQPIKKQKHKEESSATNPVSDSKMLPHSSGTAQGVDLLPMQLPTSSKLRISHHRGVRAESNWVGLDVLLQNTDAGTGAKNDRLVGLCGHGKLYIADSANLMKLAI